MKNTFLALCTSLVLLVSFFAYDAGITGSVFEEYDHWGLVGEGTPRIRNIEHTSPGSPGLSYYKSSPSTYYEFLGVQFDKDPDINGDGFVNREDFNILQTIFGRTGGGNKAMSYNDIEIELTRHWLGEYAKYVEKSDLNGDGFITMTDYWILFYYAYKPEPIGPLGYASRDYGTRPEGYGSSVNRLS